MYNLFFQPLVDILKYIYLFIVKLTGNYGLSLILLSIVVNIILRPISNWAAKVQNKERKIQGILAPQIADIKKNYHGAEQHAELNELYKAYGYNPIYAVRSGLDLFIQLPLLTAAYIMLSSLDALNGQSFGIIKNLLLPDNLFMGINILPILMTVINFLATLTTKSFTKRERVQAFIIAILFLILLYDAPSALLIYWTMNNFIMLIKNFADVKAVSSCFEKISQILNYRYTPSGLWVAVVRVLTFALVIFSVGAYFYYLIGNATANNSIIMRTSAYNFIVLFSFVFVWMLFLRAVEQDFYIFELLIKVAYLIGGIALILFCLKRFIFISGGPAIPQSEIGRFFIALTVSYIAFGFILPIKYEKFLSFSHILTGGKDFSMFFMSVISVTIFFCVFAPSVIYHSDPVMFSESLSLPSIIAKISSYGVRFLLISIIMWLLISKISRRLLSTFTAFTACIFFINAFILTENSGGLDLIRMPGIFYAIKQDMYSVILSLFLFAVLVFKKRMAILVHSFAVLSLAMLGVGIYCNIDISYRENNYANSGNIEQERLLPSFHNELWGFSKTNKNVIGMFLDAFTGDHVYKIIEDDPKLAEALDGFIYFPDTIATGGLTFYSSPSMYGGPRYSPLEHNRLTQNKTLLESFVEAYTTLPNAFAENGYDVVMADFPYIEKIGDNIKEKMNKSVLFLSNGMGLHYVHYWEQWASQNNIEYQINDNAAPTYVFMWSLIRVMPFSLRVGISGYLKDSNAQFYFKQSFMPNIYIQFMKDFVTVSDGKPKLKIIYNLLSHTPWLLSANSLQPVLDPSKEKVNDNLAKGITPSHYYTERHILHFIADFVASLKRLGVYDNTRIVLYSDHDAGDSWKLHSIFENGSYPGSPNSLMLFKDFNSHGNIRASDALMSCEDAPSLIAGGLISIDGIPDIEQLKDMAQSERLRTHSNFAREQQPFSDYKYNPTRFFKVKGTMFKKENWTKIQK